jgi:hypothetical protein
MSVGLQGYYILTLDPDRLANRRPSRLFSYFSYFSYSASLRSLSAVNYRAELYMLLYNYGNTLIYLYLDLQSEYYQLSLHFIDPGLATDTSTSGYVFLMTMLFVSFIFSHLCIYLTKTLQFLFQASW